MLRCLCVVLTLLLYCGLPPASHAEELWNVGTWKTAQTIQPFLYQNYAENARVVVHPFTNPADQKSALLAGSLDMTGTTLALAIQAASRGEPVVLVAALGNKCSALVVRKDSNIADIRELRGKRIGYVPGTMHEILLRETLIRAGLKTSDVALIRVDFFDMGTALSRGDIDAYLSGEPLPTLAVQQGYGRILAYPYYEDRVGDINSGMLMRRDFIESHPQQAMRMVRAHCRASEAMMQDRDSWLALSASLFGLELTVLREAANNMELAWDMDEVFLRRLKALGERMRTLGMIDREPDYARLVDQRFVETMRREAAAR